MGSELIITPSKSNNIDEKRLPWPGGIKKEYEIINKQEDKFNYVNNEILSKISIQK